MLEELNQTLEEQIQKCKYLDTTDVLLFTSLFQALGQEQQSLFSHLQTVVAPNQTTSTPFSVATTVAPPSKANTLEHMNFFPILPVSPIFFPVEEQLSIENAPSSQIYGGFGFLQCVYQEINHYVARTYQGEYRDLDGKTHSISYSLVPSDQYLREETILFQIREQYQSQYPPIFSPLSRRMVNVMIHWETHLPLGGQFSFCWDSNELSSVLLTDSILYWNLFKENSDTLPSLRPTNNIEILPFFQTTQEVLEYNLEEHEYLWIKPLGYDVKREKNKIYIGFHENTPQEDVSFQKCSILPLEDYQKHLNYPVFNTGFEPRKVQKERIITQGDLFFVVEQFQGLGLKLKTVQTTLNQGKSIHVYATKDHYRYHTSPFPRKPTPLYLVLEPRENTPFFVDKVSYLMDYLNYFYPEFRYVGVLP